MRRNVATLSVLFLLSTGGCSAAGGPESAARSFWDAVMAGDKETAKKYVTKNSIAELELDPAQSGETRDIELGRAVETGDQASIPTTLITKTADQEVRVPLNTILLKEDGNWKVDWNQTLASLLGGMMGEMMKGMSDAMKTMSEEMGKSFEEMSKSFDEAMQAPPQ